MHIPFTLTYTIPLIHKLSAWLDCLQKLSLMEKWIFIIDEVIVTLIA